MLRGRRASIVLDSDHSHECSTSAAPRSGSSASRASWAASRARTCRTSASRRCAASTRESVKRPRRWTRACARSRCARSGSCCCTTRRRPRRSRASAERSGRSSAPTGSRRRSSSTTRTWSCTATPTRARSRAALGEVPVYNVSVPVMGEDFWVFELAGERRAPVRSPLASPCASAPTSLRSGSASSGGFRPPSVVASAWSPAVEVDALGGRRRVVAGRAADARGVVVAACSSSGHDALVGRLGPGALVFSSIHGQYPVPVALTRRSRVVVH